MNRRAHLKNARLVDGTGATARDGVALAIAGDTIVHAGPLSAADAPSAGDVEVVASTASRCATSPSCRTAPASRS